MIVSSNENSHDGVDEDENDRRGEGTLWIQLPQPWRESFVTFPQVVR